MGHDHCAWLAEDGSVWTSGDNNYGQLGLSDQLDKLYPSRVPNLPPISFVRSGCFSTLCLDTSGNIWSFGYNTYGQLGLGDTVDRSSPCMVPGVPPVLSFSFTYVHTTCLCEDGSIWSFGRNLNGQLGLGHENHQSSPVQLPSSYFPDEIISVECGYGHSLFLTSKGQVFSCGFNGKGQLGLGDYTSRSTPTLVLHMSNCIQISCGGNMSCMVDSSHRLWVCGSHKSRKKTPVCFPSAGLVQNISVGYQQTLCINQNGELWGWGDPSSGELGNGSKKRCTTPILLNTNIQSCLCLGNSSFTRNASGEDYCCGKNSSGQLGLGDDTKTISFRPFNPRDFTMKFPKGKEGKVEKTQENGTLAELLGIEGLKHFLEIELIANKTKNYLKGTEAGSRKIRAAGWKKKAAELEGQVQTILLATADMKETFDKNSHRIETIKEEIEHHKNALVGLEEELREVQMQANQFTTALENDIIIRRQELMERVLVYAEEETKLNEELTGLLESKRIPDLSSTDLAILLWKMDLPHVYPIIEGNEINGELLCSLTSHQMAAIFRVTNQEAYTMEYHLKLMQCNRYSINDLEDTDCPVCSHNTPQKTIYLMAEHKIPIPPERIKDGQWTTPQIIYSDLVEFQLSVADQISCTKGLSLLKKCHQEHLVSLSQ